MARQFGSTLMWRPGGSRAARTSARPRAGHCSGKLRAAHAAVLRRAFLFSSARSDLQRSRPKSARDTLPSSMSRHSAAALGSYRGAADRDERRPKGIKGESWRVLLPALGLGWHGSWPSPVSASCSAPAPNATCRPGRRRARPPFRFPATATLPRAKILPLCKVNIRPPACPSRRRRAA